jgi:hypothetical protein
MKNRHGPTYLAHWSEPCRKILAPTTPPAEFAELSFVVGN